VIDEQSPGPPQMKTALPSLPTAPSLSPIKRKTKGEKDGAASPGTPTQDGKSTPKAAQKGWLNNPFLQRLPSRFVIPRQRGMDIDLALSIWLLKNHNSPLSNSKVIALFLTLKHN